MHYLNSSINWEEFFIQEALELEEKMKTLDTMSLDKPKLLLALEHNILDWSKYEAWATYHLGCASFKSNINPSELSQFTAINRKTYEAYAAYPIWDSELIPFIEWDNKVYVLGLQYHDKLVSIENHVLLLTPPHVISYFYKKLFSADESEIVNFDIQSNDNDNQISLEDELESSLESTEDSKTEEENSDLTGDLNLDFSVASPKIDFNGIQIHSSTSVTPANNSESSTIWDYISERHEEYSFEAKKQFNAYIVLKIEQNKTKVFKMDAELAKEAVDTSLFEFDVNQENPFHKVFESGYSESFSISQLGFQFKDYKYACITALKRGNSIVGFLLGLKQSHLSEADQSLLEDLSKESA